VRFITEVVKGSLVVSNKKKADIVQELTSRGYTALSSKELKQKKEKEEGEEENDDEAGPKRNYDYLLSMPILSLTLEKVKSLQADRDAKVMSLCVILRFVCQDRGSSCLWSCKLMTVHKYTYIYIYPLPPPLARFFFSGKEIRKTLA
jgi:hypothetical protein